MAKVLGNKEGEKSSREADGAEQDGNVVGVEVDLIWVQNAVGNASSSYLGSKTAHALTQGCIHLPAQHI